MADNKEIGRIGQRRYGGVIYEEFLHELRGKRGIEAYREMSENDDVVGAILFAIEMLVRQTDWNVEPGGDSQADIDAAEFVESCMNDMQNTWIDTISEILSFLTFGWSYHEIVYKRRMGRTKDGRTRSKYADGLIGWRKLPIRAQETLYQWEYKGMHPAVRAELENLKKFREATEERELEGVAKKYEIIGKKKEELVPVLKNLKAAGGTAYTDMIAVLDGAVAAVEKSGAFTEIGKSGGAGTTDGAAWLKAETQAAEVMKSKNVTKAQALDEVFQNDPELAAECEKEE